jgi:low temperature requirement protein LtrA
MLITVSIPLAAAICYAGMLGAASTSNQLATHDMLFVISMFEIVGNLAVSLVRKYKVVSFEGSHLAERLNLLTLIILGEGEFQHSDTAFHE